MAKADLTLPDGTRVTVEGTPDEVAAVLGRFSGDPRSAAQQKTGPRLSRGRRGNGGSSGKDTKSKPPGPTDYIREIIDEGYFKTKREIAAVRDKLEEGGHIYPVTSLSGPLLRLVKNKELRRLKEGGSWKYVNA